VITIDTLRADHVGAYGFPLARTPAMDGLAKDGVRCANATAVAPITMVSHTSIFTGLLPPAHGVRDNGSYALGDKAVTLAERLKAAGYETQAFVSALVLNRRYNLNQGFDGYDDNLWAEDSPKLFLIRDRVAAKTAALAGRWLDRWEMRGKKKPFFLWVHFYDPHQPYKVRGPAAALAPSPYDAEIAVADHGVQEILNDLESKRLLDDTLIVLTADHGESLGEHGEKTHAIFIYDATVRVPLFFRWPGYFPAGKVYQGPVRSVDIVPTILGALGLPGGGETQGADLGPALRGKVPPPRLGQYSESLLAEVGFGMAPLYGVRLDGYKWIRAPRPELYDLKRDPHELHDLAARQPRIAVRLDRELSRLLADSERHKVASARRPLDEETEEMLRALGYLAPPAQRRAVQGMDPKDGIVLYQKLDDARHFAQAAKWADSERLLREILAVTPNNLSAVNVLALVRWEQGDVAGARREYAHSLALDPNQFRVFGMLGAIAVTENELDEAERQFRRGLQVNPVFVEAMSNLGFLAALRGDDKGAEAWYRKAIAGDPQYPRVWRRIADLYYERGDFPHALEYYRKALANQPDDFEATLQAGNAARRANDPHAAVRYFLAAETLRHDSWMPPYNLACLRAVSGQAEKAVTLLETSLKRGFSRSALLATDPDLAAVRQRPEYSDLLRRVKERETMATMDPEERRAYRAAHPFLNRRRRAPVPERSRGATPR
jgi:arylsulfatase A-like enzyme/tetratricopeptide (TPR) repeat protein